MKNILLLYATVEGQTEKIASTISSHLIKAGAKVTVRNVGDKAFIERLNLVEYDQLVLGASIHAGKIEKEMAAFLNTHIREIEAMPRSMFIVLMAAATKDPERRELSFAEIRRNLARQVKLPFTDIEMIAGALMYTKYNWFVRWMMKSMVRKEGGNTDTSRDHEYTDWDQVAVYARHLAEY